MGKSSKSSYYAVANGRATGVFSTWEQAEKLVKGFPGARFKKFPTSAEADAFVKAYKPSSISVSNMYTNDASHSTLRKHGRDERKAGDYSGGGESEPSAKRQRNDSGKLNYNVMDSHTAGMLTSCPKIVSPSDTTTTQHKPDFHGEPKEFLSSIYQVIPPQPTATERCSDAATCQDKKTNKDARISTPSDMSINKQVHYWYAVAKGRKTGVFDSWNEAKKHVEGLFSASFKKFLTREEAEAFVQQRTQNTTRCSTDPDPKHSDTLVAFCDGSALQNGRRGCQAGYACIFPHRQEWNVVKKLQEPRATNNRAEYLAALEAMKRANIENPAGDKILYIFSDSMLLIRSMTEWIGNWQKKNWCKADGTPVMNRDVLELLVKEKGTRRIIWRHVKAHTGRKDWQSVWNDAADVAARNAAKGM